MLRSSAIWYSKYIPNISIDSAWLDNINEGVMVPFKEYRRVFSSASLLILVFAAALSGCGEEDDRSGTWEPDAGHIGDVEGGEDSASAGAPELESAQNVEFWGVEPRDPAEGEPEWRGAAKTIQFRNTGDAALELAEVYVEQSELFDFSVPHPTEQELGAGLPPDPNNDSQDWPEVVEPGASFNLRVWFRPVDNSPVDATLVLKSNDPANPVYSVALSGNYPSSCINVTPEAQVDFGFSLSGDSSQEIITIENCSAELPLSVSAIDIVDDGGGAFELSADSLPDDLLDGAFILEPEESVEIAVDFTPVDDDEHRGELRIESDDPQRERVELTLSAQALAQSCPTAIAAARVRGESTFGLSEFSAPPLTVIEFDGTQSSALNSEVARYEWTLLSAPRESSSIIEEPNTAEPHLYVDAVGEYQVELVVYDEEGAQSCDEPAVVTIRALPESDIYIQLVWQTPGHPRHDKDSSDLDLHYLHPNAEEWSARPWDCFFRNQDPQEWRTDIDGANPVMSHDVMSGRAPETIRHSHLEDLRYKVGVNYYSSYGYGPSDATLHIFRHAVEAFAIADKELTNGQFWEVAAIDGATLEITEIDRVYEEGFPDL